MAIVTNTHTGPLGLPTGQVLERNTPTPVSNWPAIRANPVVASWIRNGLLTSEDDPVRELYPGELPNGVVPAADEKDELIAKLADKGITKDRRSSVETLQKLLEG